MTTPSPASDDVPETCGICNAGRMAPWSTLLAGGSRIQLGDQVLFARRCDRCRTVEIQARRATIPVDQPSQVDSRHSPRAALAGGLRRNIGVALAEVWRARPWRATPSP